MAVAAAAVAVERRRGRGHKGRELRKRRLIGKEGGDFGGSNCYVFFCWSSMMHPFGFSGKQRKLEVEIERNWGI